MSPRALFAICCAVYYLFQDEIKNGVFTCWEFLYNKLARQIIVKIDENPKIIFAIKQEINDALGAQQVMLARDSSFGPYYDIGKKTYTLNFRRKGIYIKFDGDYVYIYSYLDDRNIIKKFLDQIYKKYCSSEENLVFYTSNVDNWSFPIFRKPRANIDDIIQANRNIANVISDLEWFLEQEEYYLRYGYPYRRGYLLQGAPGSGKSTVIEVMAIKFNMSVYLVNLNSKDMTDTTLINIISKIPCKSIIVFEEIDKQIETMEKTDSPVSFGGILSAIDGPQRLSQGCIVVMTTNDSNFAKNKQPLFRKGRIDRIYEFE